jgi:hypothetical protein
MKKVRMMKVKVKGISQVHLIKSQVKKGIQGLIQSQMKK